MCISKEKLGTADFTVTPIGGTKAGIKFSMIQLDTTTAIGIESRRLTKFDKLNKNEEGVLIYLIDVKKGDDKGIIKILGKKRTYKDGQYLGVLTKGDQLTYNGITISVIKSMNSGDQIRIKR